MGDSSGFLDTFFGLDKKIVFVTGATGQLGNIICKAYVDLGATVIGSDSNLDNKKMVQSKKIEYVHLDITNKNLVNNVFEKVYQDYGVIDVLINNAGVSCFEPFEERSEESFEWVMDVNLKGTFFCIQEYARMVKEKNHFGNVVNIASIYGLISPDPRIYTDCERNNPEIYGATKAGIIQMTKYFAVHLAKTNIRVNCVSPGGIYNSDMPQGEDFIKNYSYRNPMGRMANAEEIIGAVFYLSSDGSSYTNGQNIVIDGGMTSW